MTIQANLATVYYSINHDLKDASITDKDRNFLNNIQTKISDISKRKPLDYRHPNGKRNLSQNELIDSVYTHYEDSLSATWEVTNNIKHAVQAKLKHANGDFNIILKNALEIIQQYRVDFNDCYNSTKSRPPCIPRKESEFYSANADTKLIQLLGGRYLPYNQSSDPLMGTAKGYCAGEVLNLIEEIEKQGRIVRTIGIDNDVFVAQQKQRHIKATKTSLKDYHPAYQKNYSFEMDWKDVSKKIIERLDARYIYYIKIHSLKEDKHATLIRRIPNSSIIEFFDSNLGIVIFDNDFCMSLWLAYHLNSEFNNRHKDISVALLPLGMQPKNAAPSIPKLSCTESPHLSTAENYSEVLNILRKLKKVSKDTNLIDSEHHSFNESTSINENKKQIHRIKQNLFCLDFLPGVLEHREIKLSDAYVKHMKELKLNLYTQLTLRYIYEFAIQKKQKILLDLFEKFTQANKPTPKILLKQIIAASKNIIDYKKDPWSDLQLLNIENEYVLYKFCLSIENERIKQKPKSFWGKHRNKLSYGGAFLAINGMIALLYFVPLVGVLTSTLALGVSLYFYKSSMQTNMRIENSNDKQRLTCNDRDRNTSSKTILNKLHYKQCADAKPLAVHSDVVKKYVPKFKCMKKNLNALFTEKNQQITPTLINCPSGVKSREAACMPLLET